MWIKWIDKHRGHVRNERWEKISEGKAMEMIRRLRPNSFEQAKNDLFYGGEVRTDNWVITATDPHKKNQAGTFMSDDPDAAFDDLLPYRAVLLSMQGDCAIMIYPDGRLVLVEHKKP